MKRNYLFLLLILSNLTFCQISEEILFENFKKTMSIGNEAFVIINVTDLNTNSTKEYCSTNNELIRALEIEFNNSSRKAFKIIRKSKSINFEFKKKEALELFEYSYSIETVDNFEKKVEIEKIIPNINDQWRISLLETKGNDYLYGYSLTKKGFIIGIDYNCFGFDGLWCLSCLD